jgi:hypothetical protein
VSWFVRFANARWQFHHCIEGKIRKPSRAQTTTKTAKQIITEHQGRPRQLQMGSLANENLWLILIWPIALHHGWTYRDVVRALRLHFGFDYLKRPCSKMSSQESAKVIESWFECNSSLPPVWKRWAPDWMTKETAMALEGFVEWRNPTPPARQYVPEPLIQRRKESLKVSDSDAEAMRLRCKRLGLDPLKPRRRDTVAQPRFFDLANSFHGNE